MVNYVYIAECCLEEEDWWADAFGRGYPFREETFNLGIFDSEDKAIQACNNFDPENEEYFYYERWVRTRWYVSRYTLNTGDHTGIIVWGKTKSKKRLEDKIDVILKELGGE